MKRHRAPAPARILTLLIAAVFFAALPALAQGQQQSPLLVMISVDGMRPDYVTGADAHGAKIPQLRRFMKEGSYADGVVGVVPTVTYPSHTTLVTGVWPAKHGILGNTTFDPLQKNSQGWYWYTEDIRVPTLWDAAAGAGRTTASVQRPALLTLHLIALDHIEHDTGPFSPEAIAILERLDAAIGNVRQTAEQLAPGRAYVAVVSDHGFAKTDAQLNLFPLFRQAKLFTTDDKGKISDWRAMPWVQSASAAIMLKDPADALTLKEVRELLAKVAADPANGIDRILDADELHKRGGFPTASFFVSLQPAWKMGGALEGPVLVKTKPAGSDGELPDLPDLRAAFFLVGPGVPQAHSFGIIDMRDVAPTVAHRIGLAFPSAEGKDLLP